MALADASAVLLDISDVPAKPKTKRHPRDLKAKQAAALALQADVAQRAAALAQPVVATVTAAPLTVQAPAPVVATTPAVMKKKPYPRPLSEVTVDAVDTHAGLSGVPVDAVDTHAGLSGVPVDAVDAHAGLSDVTVDAADKHSTLSDVTVDAVEKHATALAQQASLEKQATVTTPAVASKPIGVVTATPMIAQVAVAPVDETVAIEPVAIEPVVVEPAESMESMNAETMVMEAVTDPVVKEPLAVLVADTGDIDPDETSPNKLLVADVVKHAEERAAKAVEIKLGEFDTRSEVVEGGVFNEEPLEAELADNTNSTPRVKVALPAKPAAEVVVVEDDNNTDDVPTGVLPKCTDVLVSPVGSNAGWAERRPTPWKTHPGSSARRRAVALAASFAAVVGCFGGISQAAANPIRFELGGSVSPGGLPWGFWLALLLVVVGVVTGVVFVMRRRQAWAARMEKQEPPASRAALE